MDNFDPYNVLLAIATNIPVLLKTAFMLQGHIYHWFSSGLTLLFSAGALVFSGDVNDPVSVDIKGDFNLRDATRSRRDADLFSTQTPVDMRKQLFSSCFFSVYCTVCVNVFCPRAHTRVNCPRTLLSVAISRSPWQTLISTWVCPSAAVENTWGAHQHQPVLPSNHTDTLGLRNTARKNVTYFSLLPTSLILVHWHAPILILNSFFF